jgi:hypothetical protein
MSRTPPKQSKKTPSTRNLRPVIIIGGAVLFIALLAYLFISSSNDEAAPSSASHELLQRPAGTIQVKIVHSRETSLLVRDLVKDIEKRSITLNDGSLIRVNDIEEEDITAAQQLSQGALRAEAWLVAPHELTAWVNAQKSPLGSGFSDCIPVFSSKLVLVTKRIDAEIYLSHSTSTPINALLERTGIDGDQTRAKLTIHNPRRSGIGLATLYGVAEMALGSLQITADTLSRSVRYPEYRALISDTTSLPHAYGFGLERRSNVIAGFITTEQEALSLKAQALQDKGESSYVYVPLNAPTPVTYALCISDAPWVSTAQKVSIRRIATLLKENLAQSVPTKSLYGFEAVPPATPETSGTSSSDKVDAIRYLTHEALSKTPQKATTLVLDTTERISPTLFTEFHGAALLFGDKLTKLTPRSIITVGEQVTTLRAHNEDLEALSHQTEDAIRNIRYGGSALLLAGVQEAFEKLKQEHRGVGSIIVMTSDGARSGGIPYTLLEDMLASEPSISVTILEIQDSGEKSVKSFNVIPTIEYTPTPAPSPSSNAAQTPAPTPSPTPKPVQVYAPIKQIPTTVEYKGAMRIVKASGSQVKQIMSELIR